MAGLCLGSSLRNLTKPRLPTDTSVTSNEMALVAGSPRPLRVNGVGRTCHWRSGAWSDGMERLNPPASATFDVSGPECRYRHRTRFDGLAASHNPGVLGVCHMVVTTGRADRFAPPPGRSACPRIPRDIRYSAAPRPD